MVYSYQDVITFMQCLQFCPCLSAAVKYKDYSFRPVMIKILLVLYLSYSTGLRVVAVFYLSYFMGFRVVVVLYLSCSMSLRVVIVFYLSFSMGPELLCPFPWA